MPADPVPEEDAPAEEPRTPEPHTAEPHPAEPRRRAFLRGALSAGVTGVVAQAPGGVETGEVHAGQMSCNRRKTVCALMPAMLASAGVR